MWLGEGRARWARFVDSRWKCGVPEREGELPDEGVCEATENGDELERGLMVNPTTGKVEQYEEVWRDEKVPRGARAVAAVLIKNEKIQGVWVRVGRWCQGVVDVGDGKVNASRWMFQESEWVEVERYGQADWLPSPHGCTLQDTYIRWGNDDWTVEEDYMY